MAEKIRFNCSCGKNLVADPEAAGNCIDCSRCGETLRVPAPAWASTGGGLSESERSRSFAQAQTPNAKSQSKGKSFWGGGDDFLSQQDLESACPMCGARMSGHALVCLVCGHNKKATKTNGALAGDNVSLEVTLPESGDAKQPARERAEQANGAAKLLIAGSVIVLALAVGAFFSKPIGLAAVLVGLIALVLGICSSLIGGVVDLTQNTEARRNFFHGAMLAAFIGPLGFIALPRNRNRPYSRLSNLGRLLVLVGLPLMIFGSMGLAKQAPRRVAKPPVRAQQWPAEVDKQLKQRTKR